MASVKAAYAIDKQWSVSLGYDSLSGSDGEGDKFKAFDPLYGCLLYTSDVYKRQLCLYMRRLEEG